MGGKQQQLSCATAVLDRARDDHHRRGVPEDLEIRSLGPGPSCTFGSIVPGELFRPSAVAGDTIGPLKNVENPGRLSGERRRRLGCVPNEILDQVALHRLVDKGPNGPPGMEAGGVAACHAHRSGS